MHASHTEVGARRTMCERLDESARARLIARAALFGIVAVIDGRQVRLHVTHQDLSLNLPMEVGLTRLVAELAGAVAPWVIFSAGKPPERVLLQYTDLKYRKLVALWQAFWEQAALR